MCLPDIRSDVKSYTYLSTLQYLVVILCSGLFLEYVSLIYFCHWKRFTDLEWSDTEWGGMPFHSAQLCLFQWYCLANHNKPASCHKGLAINTWRRGARNFSEDRWFQRLRTKKKSHIFSNKFWRDIEMEVCSETQKKQIKYREAPVTLKRLWQEGNK